MLRERQCPPAPSGPNKYAGGRLSKSGRSEESSLHRGKPGGGGRKRPWSPHSAKSPLQLGQAQRWRAAQTRNKNTPNYCAQLTLKVAAFAQPRQSLGSRDVG